MRSYSTLRDVTPAALVAERRSPQQSSVHSRMCRRQVRDSLTEKEVDVVPAYIDGGTASLLIQAIAGGVAAVAVIAKLYWGRLLRFLRIRKPEERASSS